MTYARNSKGEKIYKEKLGCIFAMVLGINSPKKSMQNEASNNWYTNNSKEEFV
ncbi:hypothetical protein AwDysgo_00070 [Bacteroidales bacterium]|nr:hypothetical protein AwDysgo_00070 [Bacteroidales bacterium]